MSDVVLRVGDLNALLDFMSPSPGRRRVLVFDLDGTLLAVPTCGPLETPMNTQGVQYYVRCHSDAYCELFSLLLRRERTVCGIASGRDLAFQRAFATALSDTHPQLQPFTVYSTEHGLSLNQEVYPGFLIEQVLPGSTDEVRRKFEQHRDEIMGQLVRVHKAQLLPKQIMITAVPPRGRTAESFAPEVERACTRVDAWFAQCRYVPVHGVVDVRPPLGSTSKASVWNAFPETDIRVMFGDDIGDVEAMLASDIAVVVGDPPNEVTWQLNQGLDDAAHRLKLIIYSQEPDIQGVLNALAYLRLT